MNEDESEVLKAGAEAAVRPFANLIDKLFGGSAEQIGGIWEDRIAVERQIRRFRLFKKLHAAIDYAGFEPRRIPDNVWVPALREAVLEDDESLREKWANLLANSADPREINPVRPTFAQILKEFTPLDARFLDELYERVSRLPSSRVMTINDLLTAYSNPPVYPQLRVSKLTDHDEKDGNPIRESSDFPAAIDVLLRHRILGESTTPNPIEMPSSKWTRGLPRSIKVTARSGYHLTALGIAFVKACQAPRSAL
jgi:hypothetical protein